MIRLIFDGQDSVDRSIFGPAREAIRVAESLRNTPGIESVGIADEVTFNSGAIGNQASRPDNPAQPGLSVMLLRVDENYFETLHMPLVSGRRFTSGDGGEATNVAILAETTAAHLFPGTIPVGRMIRVGVRSPYDLQIVGVVKDIKYRNVRDQAPDLLYQPLIQPTNRGAAAGSGMMNLHVRSRLSPSNLAAIVRDRIRQEHVPVTLDAATALQDEIGATLLNDRIRMQASSLFGALALLLITAGIYGLMAHSAVRRTREIGIRMAVGSSPTQIAQLMLKESTRLVVLGVFLGIPGALAVMKAVSGLVFGLPPVDGVSLAAAALILSATGIAASVGPAWRAARLDPVNALRLE